MRRLQIMKLALPRTAKDVFKLSAKDWLIYNGIMSVYRAAGLWRYPFPTNGDFESMNRLDLIYWLYKAQFPVKRATKNSGLEEFFEEQSAFRWALPQGFEPTAELELSAVGDLMDHLYLPNSAEYLYERICDTVLGADISMANLECVVDPKGSGSFTITTDEAPPIYYKMENFNAAKGSHGRNYTFLATANNHSLDCGESGVESTIRTLKQNGIAFHGMNESEKNAENATIIEKKGFKIGFVSHTFGLNAKKPPKNKPWIVNRTYLNRKLGQIDFRQIERQLQHCRENTVDAAILQLHWGLEHEYYPRPEQLEVAHHLAEMGFDLIIGHHPHLVQPTEYYRTLRDPDRVVPIYYSLGNLITPFSHPAFRKSGVAQIKLAKGIFHGSAVRTYVKEASLVEVFQQIDEQKKQIYLEPFGGQT